MDPPVVIALIEGLQPIFQFLHRPESLFSNRSVKDIVKALYMSIFLRCIGVCEHLIDIVFPEKFLDLNSPKLRSVIVSQFYALPWKADQQVVNKL